MKWLNKSKKQNDEQLRTASEQLREQLKPLDSKTPTPMTVAPAAIEHLLGEVTPEPDSTQPPKARYPKLGTRLISVAAAAMLLVVGIWAVVDNRNGQIENSGNKGGFVQKIPDGEGNATVAKRPGNSVDDNIDPNDYTKVYNALQPLMVQAATQNKQKAGLGEMIEDAIDAITGGARKSADMAPGDTATGLEENETGNYDGNGAPEPSALPHTDDGSDADSDKHGETNEQVKGVHEADILKTDGQYLYYLRQNNDDINSGTFSMVLEIVKVGKDGKMERLTATNLSKNDPGFTATEMYIYNNYLVVTGTDFVPNPEVQKKQARTGVDYTDDMAYGGEQDTKIVLYDITDRKAVKRLREFKQQGSLVSSRMIDKYLYIISSYYCQSQTGLTKESVKEYVPCTTDDKGEVSLIPAGDIAIMPAVAAARYTVACALDITDAESIGKLAVLGGGENVYASLENIFVAAMSYSDESNGGTDIMKFSVSGAGIRLKAQGTVKGTILNQFAMDEYDGYFRIATTRGWSGEQGNNLYILDGDLKEAGAVTGLAKGETIRSVRFAGAMGYVVTFRQTDPLFAIDLSNPKAPKVKSALKIPGFSSYMHPLDENTLVGIGTDGDESGRTFGVKLSLFDVTNPEDVKESHKFTIGGDGSSSEAWYTHKAVTYIAEQNLFIIPVQLQINNYSGSGMGTFFGFVAVKVDKKAGFTEVARMTTAVPNADFPGRYQGISHFTGARSTYIGDTLYAVDGGTILAVSLKNFTVQGSLSFPVTAQNSTSSNPAMDSSGSNTGDSAPAYAPGMGEYYFEYSGKVLAPPPQHLGGKENQYGQWK